MYFLLPVNSWTLFPLICRCGTGVWGYLICLGAISSQLQNCVCISYLSCASLTTPKCQCLLFVLENYARWLRNLPTLWSWVILFPMSSNSGRRSSKFHHRARLSTGLIIKKLPSLLKIMFCERNLTVICSESRKKEKTKPWNCHSWTFKGKIMK